MRRHIACFCDVIIDPHSSTQYNRYGSRIDHFLSLLRCLALFFLGCCFCASTLQLDDNTCYFTRPAIENENVRKCRSRSMSVVRVKSATHAADMLIPQPKNRACVTHCGKCQNKRRKNSSRSISFDKGVSII